MQAAYKSQTILTGEGARNVFEKSNQKFLLGSDLAE